MNKGLNKDVEERLVRLWIEGMLSDTAYYSARNRLLHKSGELTNEEYKERQVAVLNRRLNKK